MQNKRSFFERLTGAVRLEEEKEQSEHRPSHEAVTKPNIFEESDEEAQLTVDVYQTPSEIIIKTMVAGVKPDDLDVSISRNSVTIRGQRSEDRTVSNDEYFHRELYWGSFARTITLPEEIDVDGAEAIEKHGMLVLHLPKLDKNRQAKLRVKGN
ncbi:MAG: Hsp20/alpha crystallin family protein [bacterium]|nr:Hsp20/alpha crystallin family protein [bacterium]MDZ4205995.1 Hsp20/alpha crystallin family protein [Patescibacteria group bacterium]